MQCHRSANQKYARTYDSSSLRAISISLGSEEVLNVNYLLTRETRKLFKEDLLLRRPTLGRRSFQKTVWPELEGIHWHRIRESGSGHSSKQRSTEVKKITKQTARRQTNCSKQRSTSRKSPRSMCRQLLTQFGDQSEVYRKSKIGTRSELHTTVSTDRKRLTIYSILSNVHNITNSCLDVISTSC